MPQGKLVSFAVAAFLATAATPLERQPQQPPQTPPELELSDQEGAVVDWLRENAIPLRSVEAGNGFEDMQPIRQIVGDARIVSLGESTHGTREIFQAKHRMLEFLVHEMGFTLFGIEASMPDCIAINNYVLHGRGNVRAAVAAQGFWTWNTEEVVEMVEWMRAYNADPANEGKPKLKFYGFDMQNPLSAVTMALELVQRIEPEKANEFRPRVMTDALDLRAAGTAAPQVVSDTETAVAQLGDYLEQNADQYLAASSADELAMARRCVVVTQQGMEMLRQMHGQSDLAARQQLVMRLPGQLRALLKFLEANPGLVSDEMIAFIVDIGNIEAFAEKYMAASTTDADRARWKQLAVKLGEAVAKVDEPGDAPAQAADLAEVLELLSEVPRREAGGIENVRDRCMAQNVQWILEHEGPEARIVLWSHNGHANVTPGDPEATFAAMGSYLEKWFGDDHVPIGFAFGRGSFQAVPARPGIVPPGTAPGLPEWKVDLAKPGSVDRVMAAADIPIFIVDLRAARNARGEVQQWMTSPHPWRMAGAIFDPTAEDQYYRVQAPAEAFEAVIYIAETTRAIPSSTGGMMGRPRLGIQFGPTQDGTAGVVINAVFEGLPAEAAGLKAGDLITHVGETLIRDTSSMPAALAPHFQRGLVPLRIVRDGATLEIEVKLGEPEK